MPFLEMGSWERAQMQVWEGGESRVLVLSIDLRRLRHISVELSSGQLDFARGPVWRLKLELKRWLLPV